MISQRCQRTVTSSEGAKCPQCLLRRDTKRIMNVEKIPPESGDVGLQWRCALCQALAEETVPASSKENILNVINALCDKFEVVNKIQLPKLNGELVQIKGISDYIAKQNEDILRKIIDIEKRKNKEMKGTHHGYRKRHLKLIHRSHTENNDLLPIVSSEKKMRYRTRRRSYAYLLNRLLHILNRKMNRTRMSPRKRHR